MFGGRALPTTRHAGAGLVPGDVAVGPAVIDLPTTTVVVPPGWRARLDDRRGIHLERDREDS